MGLTILIICGLVISISYVLLLIFKQKINKNYQHIMNLSISLVGTFIGVFLALYLNNASVEKQNKKRLESLYDAAINDFQNIYLDIDTKLKSEIWLRKAGLKTALPQPPDPVIIQSIIGDATLHRYFSPTFRNNVFTFIRNLRSLINSYASNGTIGHNISVLTVLRDEIKFQMDFIKYEKKYLKKEIKSDEIEAIFKKLLIDTHDTHHGVSPQQK